MCRKYCCRCNEGSVLATAARQHRCHCRMASGCATSAVPSAVIAPAAAAATAMRAANRASSNSYTNVQAATSAGTVSATATYTQLPAPRGWSPRATQGASDGATLRCRSAYVAGVPCAAPRLQADVGHRHAGARGLRRVRPVPRQLRSLSTQAAVVPARPGYCTVGARAGGQPR